MALDRITLSAFRNHRASRIDGTGQLNLLVGENGAGKTNVLEAISLFAPGRGLRRAALADMAFSQGPGGFTVSAELAAGDAGEPVQLGTGTDPARPGRRIVQVNSAEASAISLGEWLALSWLTPAMDRLFADSAGARRRYMDRLTLALDPAHARRAARYEAALRERNRILSHAAEPDPRWLDAIEAAAGRSRGGAGRRARRSWSSGLRGNWPACRANPLPGPCCAMCPVARPRPLRWPKRWLPLAGAIARRSARSPARIATSWKYSWLARASPLICVRPASRRRC